jgi:hypothetical protein
MTDYIVLNTVGEVRKAVKKAKHVWVAVRVGVLAPYVAVSKKDVLEQIFTNLKPDFKLSDISERYRTNLVTTSPDGYTIWIG